MPRKLDEPRRFYTAICSFFSSLQHNRDGSPEIQELARRYEAIFRRRLNALTPSLPLLPEEPQPSEPLSAPTGLTEQASLSEAATVRSDRGQPQQSEAQPTNKAQGTQTNT